MRYEISIERSAELLRQALPWMSRQTAALHPVSYAVWFDYVAQTNQPLRAAIDEHLAREGSLDEFATHALFRRHVADVDPESAQRVVDGMQRVLGGIGEATGSAGATAARFSASLAQLAGALERGDTARGIGEDFIVARNGPAPRRLEDVVAEVIADTGTMRTQIAGLQQRLADSRRDIERLRDEVRRARDLALRDSLTGLSNRRAFDQALAACLAALSGDTGSPAARAAAAAATGGASVAPNDAAMAPSASRPPRPSDRRFASRDAAAPNPVAFTKPSPAIEHPSGKPSSVAAEFVVPRGPWLLMSDIDHFKHINDAHGASFGDEVLKAVAEALRGLAPNGSTIARVGGEAFALLVPELDGDGARSLAERMRQLIASARIRRPGHEEAERITLSLGVAPHRAGETAQAFVERAGAALRQAKRDGRDRVVSVD